jgi:tricorn protease
VWGVWLTSSDHQRTPAEWLKVWKDTDEKKDDKSEEAVKDQEAPAPPTVVIEFDRLWERVESITDLKGNEGAALVAPDGKRIVFTAEHEGERDLYSVRWDGDKLERLTTDGQEPQSVQLLSSGETVFYLDKKGVVKRVGIDGEAGDPVPFTARYEVDRFLERGVVFDEAWSAIDTWFYDPEFHGVDWPAQRATYRPWALAASSEPDFADVVNLMFGELNASHMGYRPRSGSNGEETGFIGAFFDPEAGGPGLRIREVLPDSPATRHDVQLATGDRILSVGGRSVEDDTNIHELFANTVEQRLPLRVVGADGGERSVTVIPVSSGDQVQLRYEEWVRQRRALVEKWSAGRLGYIHIQAMNMVSFEEFERGDLLLRFSNTRPRHAGRRGDLRRSHLHRGHHHDERGLGTAADARMVRRRHRGEHGEQWRRPRRRGPSAARPGSVGHPGPPAPTRRGGPAGRTTDRSTSRRLVTGTISALAGSAVY